jgi:hypothetical protein
MSHDQNEDVEFAALLQGYAAPIADGGFTVSTLARLEARAKLRQPILIGAACIGGAIALSQMPSLLTLVDTFVVPEVQPFILTAVGLFGFVGWAALDRGWADAV